MISFKEHIHKSVCNYDIIIITLTIYWTMLVFMEIKFWFTFIDKTQQMMTRRQYQKANK